MPGPLIEISVEELTNGDFRLGAGAEVAHHGGAFGSLFRNVPSIEKVDPRMPGHDSGTALHCAAWEGSVGTVATLLRHRDARALVSIRDAHYAATPLGWCCHGSLHGDRSHDHAGVARLLLDAGARPGPDTANASPAVLSVIASGRRG